MATTQVKSLAMDVATLAAGSVDGFGSPGWCSAAEDYRIVSYDLVRVLCEFVSGLDQETPIAIALNTKLADIIADLARLSRLVVDLANLQRRSITPIFQPADNPILDWLCQGGPGDGTVVCGYSSARWKLAKARFTPRWTAKTLRRRAQMITVPPSRRRDTMNFNPLLSEFARWDGRLVSDIVSPLAGWCQPDAVPPCAAESAAAITERYEALVRREVDAAPTLLDSAVRGARASLRYHLAGALADLAHLREDGPRRIGHLFISGTPKYVGRMLSRYYREQGSRIFRFAHGGERVFFEDYNWGVTELPYCDRYYTHSQAEARAINHRLQIGRIASLPSIRRDFASLGSYRHQQLLTANHATPRGKSNTVMYLPSLYMGERILNVPALRAPDPQYYEWQIWVLGAVRKLGYRIAIKLHPKGWAKWNRLLEPYADEIITGYFDANAGDACCYLFDFSGTAFFDALASNRGVVFLYHGGRRIDPLAADDLARRCQVVPCYEDDANRIRTSVDALAGALTQAKEFPGVSDDFSQKYFF